LTELKTANIVVLANHLPSIITPTWIKERKIIEEQSKQFVSNPILALFESENYILTIDPARLQLSTKKSNDEKILKYIPEAVTRYIDNFRGLNYRAVGLNFVWMHTPEEGEQYTINAQIQHAESKINLKSIFKEQNMKLGSIVYEEKSPYILRVVIEPADKNAFKYDFNYHYNTGNTDVDAIKKYLNSFIDKQKHSETIINQIIGIKENG